MTRVTLIVACVTVGWIAKIKLSNAKEFEALLDEAAYAKHTSE